MQDANEGRGPRHIRLLIVDDAPDTAENIQKLLRRERGLQVVGTATSGQEAIARAAALRPDVVLMDVNLRDMDGIKAAEVIGREIPTCFVMMSVQREPDTMNRAMMIGARGYLVKPFSTDKLVATIRTAVANTRLEPQPVGPATGARLKRIITVYSPKGGCGRSVLAANLAVALQQTTGKTVALVDANLQSGDLHVLLNIAASASIDDLREAGALDQDIVLGALVTHEPSGVRLLRAPVSPESAELFTAETVKNILSELREHVDYVVIDTDTHFSEATLMALELADHIVAVTTLEVTTINRVSQFFDVAERLGYPRAKIKLVCNRVDGYYGIRPAQVEARLRTRFLAQIPEDSRVVVASVNRGVPFLLGQKAAPVSQAVLALAQRLEDVAGKPEIEQVRATRRLGPFKLSS